MDLGRSLDEALEKWAANANQSANSPEAILINFLEALVSSEHVNKAIVAVERLRSLALDPDDTELSTWVSSTLSVPDNNDFTNLVAQFSAGQFANIRSAVRGKDAGFLPNCIEDGEVACIFSFQRSGVFRRVTVYLIAPPIISDVTTRDRTYLAIEAKLPFLESKLLVAAVFSNYSKRIEFHKKLLGIETTDVTKAFTSLAAAWKHATGCDWVWVWMHNADSGQWEFLACDHESSVHRLPPHISHEAARGVLAYAWHKRKPITEVAPLTWRRVEGDKEYEVVGHAGIANFGCNLLDCIPCITTSNQSARVGICLHYCDTITRVFHPVDSLATMGSVTGGVIHGIFAKQTRILEEQLNRISATVLASGQYRPAPALEKYCEEVISVIQKQIRVERVSIFCRKWNESALSCIASTGLFDKDGIRIPKENFHKCTYQIGESLTGGVFHTGEPYVSKIKPIEENHHPRYTEVSPAESESDFAFAIYQIQLPSDESTSTRTGVIRCVNPLAAFSALGNRSKNFDVFQLEAIQFVGRQIAVALEILLAFKGREKHISSIKHDLNAPLEGIRDLVARIPMPLSERAKLQSLTDFGLDIYNSMVKLVLEIEPHSTNDIPFSPQLDELKSQLNALCRPTQVHIAAVGNAYALLLRFLGDLERQIKITIVKDSMRRRWLREQRDLSKAVTTVANEATTAIFGRHQNLCLVPYHDAQNMMQNSLKAISMLTRIDLQLTTPKEFKPILTHLAGDIIARLCNSLNGWARDMHRVTIQFDLDEFRKQVPALYVDREEVERAVSNLLVNAIKYSRPDESVKIEARRTTDSFFIDFVDNGIEILPDELDRVFVEGYRSPRAIPYASGDGFGLKIARHIMQMHRGNVTITHGKNPTVVSLKFPAFLAVRRP